MDMKDQTKWRLEQHDDRPKHCLYVGSRLAGFILRQGGPSDGLCGFTMHNAAGRVLGYTEGIRRAKAKLLEVTK